MIAKQIGEPNEKAELAIRKILKDKADINDDGFFLKNDEWEMRTLDDKAAQEAITLLPINNLMAHFRMASAGKVSEGNVHGWGKGDWQFFHNGGVSEYAGFTNPRAQEEADSLQFFRDLYDFVSSITTRKSKKFDRQVEAFIRDLATDTNFHGRAALYYQPMDKMFIFGDFEVYTFGASYLIISSARLDLNKEIKREVHGFPIEYGNSAVIGTYTTKGIGVINNFSENGFNYKYLGELKDPSKPYTYGRRDNGRNTDINKYYSFENDPTWEKNEHGVWVKKPTPLPAPVHTPSCEVQTMAENIEDTMKRLEEEGGVDLSMLEKKEISQEALELDWGDSPEDAGVDPDKLDQLLLEKIQEDHGYVGIEKATGYEVYLARDGHLHDMMNFCCQQFDCQRFDDWDLIEFNTPITITGEEVIQVGFDNDPRNQH